MNWQELAAIASITSLGTAAIMTLFNWVFKARESDKNLSQTINLLAINLENNNKFLERDILQLRNDISELRIAQRQSATRSGKRISDSKIILLKFINYFNTRVLRVLEDKELVGFEFVDLEGDEEN
jgi:hypothetical protein